MKYKDFTIWLPRPCLINSQRKFKIQMEQSHGGKQIFLNFNLDTICKFYNLMNLVYYMRYVLVYYRVLISFKNLIRAIENVGIATSYVVQYNSVGSLKTDELIQFLQARAIANEYLEQASNFSPRIKKQVKRIQDTSYYKIVERR